MKTAAKDKAINKALGILSDKHGKYRVIDTYANTWSGVYAGYCVQEVREYWDGAGPMVTRIVAGDAVYLHDLGTERAHIALAWRIYREGAAAMGIKLR